mgnify:FL=1
MIDQIAKEPDLKITNNGPKLHEFLRELSRETFQKGDMITVGEAWGATPEIAKKYSNPDGSEFSMVFQFEHIMLDQEEGKEKWDTIPLNMVKLKKCLAKWQNTLYQTGWNSLFMNNHDLPESYRAGEMTENTEKSRQKCWRQCFMECRELLTFTREKSWE